MSKTRTAARAAPKKPADKIEYFDEVEQRSPEWFDLRLGLVTASALSAVMASSEEQRMRTKLLHHLAAERLLGVPSESFSNEAMDRGIALEPKALEHYAFTRGVELQRTGFVRRTMRRVTGDLVVGCSPDALVGSDGLVQIKTMRPDLLVALVDSGRFPSEHKWQCHGEICFSGRSWCDLMVYWPGFPVCPVFRIERSEEVCRHIDDQVERFDWELRELVKRIEQRRGKR